jgi:predicted RNA binding protein YcfA (HicA-like mRNA interferase family)
MATYTFNDFRKVLRKLGFENLRSARHETWRRILPDRTVLRVIISHRAGRDIPKWLFHEMLRQTGIDEAQFRNLLSRK